jgi:competence ComEA-like helix-hairpin-helix protein
MNYISKRNRVALIYVIVLTIGIAYIPRVIGLLNSEQSEIKVSEAQISELNKRISNYKKNKKYFRKSIFEKKSRFKSPLARFNPNNYSQSDWVYLGLSEKQAKVVLKFTARGIYSNDELQQVFVIPDELFELIKDSTFYTEKPVFENRIDSPKNEPSKKILSVEINAASAEELTKVNGIGPAFAKWIIDYRTKLGGFNRKEQLMEVWKIDVEKYSLIETFVKVDPSLINPIKLNSVTVEVLKAHPYLNWNKANSIIKIRDRKGGYKSITEIKESVLIDEECFENLKPYLSL